jgi:phospholipase/carboxylesterase
MLGFDVGGPRDAGDGATVAVLLHGRGSHRGDLQTLRPRLPADWVVVTPEAPYAGEPWGYGQGWAWYRYVAEDRVDDPTLERSLGALDMFLAELPAALKLTAGRLVLGGFSQGGTMSLAYALEHPGVVHAVLNFSGFLVRSPLVTDAHLIAADTRIFWGHGLQDPAIPFALAERGRARLRAANVDLTTRDYDIGHWIDPAEVADAVAFVDAGINPAAVVG